MERQDQRPGDVRAEPKQAEGPDEEAGEGLEQPPRPAKPAEGKAAREEGDAAGR